MNPENITGYLEERGISSTAHFFYRGELTFHDSDFGEYDGKIRFVYTEPRGKIIKYSRWYTLKSAPKWMIKIFNKATLHYDKENN